LSDKLLTGVIQPTGINACVLTSCVVSETHKLVNLGKSHLKISAVSQVTVSADDTLDTTTEIGLTVESLFD
jgi:hypothetical protein